MANENFAETVGWGLILGALFGWLFKVAGGTEPVSPPVVAEAGNDADPVPPAQEPRRTRVVQVEVVRRRKRGRAAPAPANANGQEEEETS